MNASESTYLANQAKEKNIRPYLRIIIALAISGLAELAALFFIQPLFPRMVVEYHILPSQVSIVLSAETACLAIGLLFTGTLSDRFGRKKIIVVSLFTGGVITLLCPLVHSWTLLVVLCGMMGMSLSGIAASATAYISEEVAPILAGVVTGYFVFGNSVGGMSGRVLASQLIEFVSIDVIYYGFAIILMLVSLIVFFMLPSSKHHVTTKSLNFFKILKEGGLHFKNKKLSLMYIISFIIFGNFTSFYNYLAFFLAREPFNVSHAHAGLISISFILSIFTAPQAGRLSAKYGSMKILTGIFVLMIVGMALTLTNNLLLFVIGAVIFTGCFFGCHSIGLSWVSKNATHAKGQATAFYLFFYYMGGAVVGYVNGQVFTALNWTGMTAAIVILLGIGIVIANYLGSLTKVVLVQAKSSK